MCFLRPLRTACKWLWGILPASRSWHSSAHQGSRTDLGDEQLMPSWLWAKVYSHCKQEKPHHVSPLEDVASCYPSQHQWEHSGNNIFSFEPSRSTEVLGSWKGSVRGVKNWSGSLQKEAEGAGLVRSSEGESGGWSHSGIPLTRGQLSETELLSVALDDT